MILSLAKIKHHPTSVQEYQLSQELPDPALAGFPDFRVIGPTQFSGTVTNRGGGLFLVEGRYQARVILACSRCLATFELPLEGEITALYGAEPGDDSSGELTYRELNGDQIALDELILDEIAFSLPMQPLCHEGCRGLCPVCGADLNHGACDCVSRETDPRWEKLADFQPAGKE
jgi:uncharacterized protein